MNLETLDEICLRLNHLQKTTGLLDSLAFSLFVCQATDPVDMVVLGGGSNNNGKPQAYATHITGLLNAVLAFRDQNNWVYRLMPVYSQEGRHLEGFVIHAQLAQEHDSVFPLTSQPKEMPK